MKKTMIPIAAIAICIPAMVEAAKSVPYSSDLSIGSVLDPEWTSINNSRRGKGFANDILNTDFSITGANIIGKTKSAILKNEKYIFWCFPAISGASV